jgi:type IV secretory pathway TraG/TraD family ATPase VirD4
LKNLIEKSGVAPTTTQEQQIVALTTIISDSKQKIDDAINTIVLTVYPMPKDGGGSNHFFYAMGQTYMKAFFTLPLDFGVSREEYNPYMCAFNAKQYGNNLVVLRDMLPEWSLAISNVAQLTAENIAAGEQNSSLQNAFDGMSIFTTETIKNLTSSSTIIFNDIIEKPTAIYVGIDTTTPDSPACRIASLFMSMMYQHLNEHLNKKASGKAFERPIHYIVDEFGNLPKMEFIQKIFSLDRSKNIVAYPVIQTDRQIKEIYGDNKFWEIINSANAVVIADVSDPQFAKMLADRAGTDFRKSVSHSTSAKGDVSSSESMHRTNEIEAGDIMNKDKFEFIVFLRRHKPYKFQINKIWETE